MHPRSSQDPPFSPSRVAKQRRAMDGVVTAKPAPVQQAKPRPAAAAPQQPALRPQSRITAAPVAQEEHPALSLQKPGKTPHRAVAYAQIGAVVAGAMIAGLFMQALPLGEIGVLTYGVIAVVRRIASRTTFILAAIALVFVPLFVVVGQPFIGERFAVYAFILLIVAVVTAAIDLWRTRERFAL